MDMTPTKTDALLIIDPQIDFTPGGALAVEGGDEIMGPINVLARQFDTVVVTQDWHPAEHKSFASAHGAEPFSETKMDYGNQTLWPDHCVQGSVGAAFHPLVTDAVNAASAIIRKGMNPEVDSYSAFYENDQKTSTGLASYLREKGITRVYLVGLAYDFCVAYSALDAVKEGFEAVVLKDLTRAIAMHVSSGLGSTTSTVDVMERKFAKEGVKIQKLV